MPSTLIEEYSELFSHPDFKTAVDEGEVCLFIGAGVARNLKMPSWSELANKIIKLCFENNIITHSFVKSIEQQLNDPLRVITYCEKKLEEKHLCDKLDKLLYKTFVEDPINLYNEKQNSVYEKLINICIHNKALIVQTNYDSVIENEIKKTPDFNLKAYVPFLNEQDVIPDLSDCIVYLHGKIGHNPIAGNCNYNNLILTREQYNDTYVLEKEIKFGNQKKFLKYLFSNYLVVFLGYSLQDLEIVNLIANKQEVQNHLEHSFTIIDSCPATSYLNKIDAKYLLSASKEKVKTYKYSTEENGFKEFEQVIQKLHDNLFKKPQISNLTKFCDYDKINAQEQIIIINELCKRLQNNNEEKWIYFKELKDPRFLEPFFDQGVLNFESGTAAVQVVNYLHKMKSNPEEKELIIQIIEKNFEFSQNYSWGTYLSLLDLFDDFDLVEDIEQKINYNRLFENSNSVHFCRKLLERDEILTTTYLYKDLIKNIIKYKIKEDQNPIYSEKIPQSLHDKYLLKKLIMDASTKNNFQKIVAKTDIYELLKSEYEQVVKATRDIRATERQMIEPLTKDDDFYYSKSSDVRQIILDCLAISLKYSIDDNSLKIEKLLEHDSSMFKKMGLYAICLDYDKYKSIFFEFLKDVTEYKDFIEIIKNCKYELITIFEEIVRDKNNARVEINTIQDEEQLNERTKIKRFLTEIPEDKKRIKYILMHGLKNDSAFKDDFNKLKKEFGGYEDKNPKLFLSIPIIESGFIVDLSPIEDENSFKKLSIEKQIKKINDCKIDKNSRWEEADDNTYETVSERGLANMFKKIVDEKCSEYLSSEHLKALNRPEIIASLFTLFSDKIKEKVINVKNLNEIITLINHFVTNVNKLGKDTGNFYFELDILISILIEQDSIAEFQDDLYNIIKKIIEINKANTEPNKISENIPNDAINMPVGRAWENLFRLIIKEKSLPDSQKEFINTQLEKKEIKYADKLFYFHLGVYIDYLFYNVKELDIISIIKGFGETQSSLFMIGYLRDTIYLKVFKAIEEVKPFKLCKIPLELRSRFVKFLVDAKFKFNEDDLFSKFEKQHFTESDIETAYRKLASEKYNKVKVIDYWKSKSSNKCIYPNLLLEIFVKYQDGSDFITYNAQLKNILDAYQQIENGSLHYDFEFTKFLEKLLAYLKAQSTDKMLSLINIIDKCIDATTSYQSVYNSPKFLKLLIKEISKKNTNNAGRLAKKACKTQGLIQYSNLFTEFIND